MKLEAMAGVKIRDELPRTGNRVAKEGGKDDKLGRNRAEMSDDERRSALVRGWFVGSNFQSGYRIGLRREGDG